MSGFRQLLIGCGLMLCLPVGAVRVAAQTDPPAGRAPDVIVVGIQQTQPAFLPPERADTLAMHEADLARAVARTQGLRVAFKLAPLAELWADLDAGRIDLLPSLARTPERQARYDLTIPHTRVQTGIFVRRGETRVKSIGELSGREILVVAGSYSQEWCEQHGFGAQLVRLAGVNEAVRALAAGTGDCLLTTQDKALVALRTLGLDNVALIEPAAAELQKEHCMVVRAGNRDLLAQLNEGLFVLKQTGELDRIYEKWRVVLPSEQNRTARAMRWVFAGMLAVLVLAGAGWIAHRAQVRRAQARLAEIEQRVAERTRELAAEKAALRRTEEFQRLVLGATNDGIFDWDFAADRFELSARGWQMLGYGPHERPAKSASWWERVHADDAAGFAAARREHLAGAGPFVHTARFRHKDGSIRWLYFRADTLRGAQGEPLRLVGSVTDLTDLKRIDEELQLSRRLRAMGELVGGIAHEFNNLLTPIMLEASLLKEDGIARATAIGDAAKRAQALTQRLLQLGHRRESGVESHRLGAIVEGTLALLRSTLDRRIAIAADIDPQLGPLQVNATTVGQAVMNLVLNARDTLLEKLAAAPPAGWRPQITVTLARAHVATRGSTGEASGPVCAWQRLSVRDNGCGIAPEVRARIFEPFFTTKNIGQGTGLGLAIVWAAAAEVGGWLDLETMPGEGTVFHVYLPDAAPPPTPPGEIAAPVRRESGRPAARRRLLFVDDDVLVGATTTRMLTHLGHEVSWLRSGDEARSHLSDPGAPWDALVTDLNMPGMGGEELVLHARRTGFRGKIVVISGQLQAQTEQRLREAGVDAMMPKPFDAQRLRALIDGLWDNRHEET